MLIISLHTHWIYSMHIFLFSFHSFSGYTGKADNSTIDSQLAHTISHSFIFFALESGSHTHRQHRIHYLHTPTRATRLPYHTIDLPFIFFLFLFTPSPRLHANGPQRQTLTPQRETLIPRRQMARPRDDGQGVHARIDDVAARRGRGHTKRSKNREKVSVSSTCKEESGTYQLDPCSRSHCIPIPSIRITGSAHKCQDSKI